MDNKPTNNGDKIENSILIAESDLKFQEHIHDEHRVTVNQILYKAGYIPTLEHKLVELTKPGTKTYDNDDEIDLDSNKPRYFVVGKTGCLYGFAVDDVPYDLPFEIVGVSELFEIACLDKSKNLRLSCAEQPDRILKSDSSFSLSGKGIERIYSFDSEDLTTEPDEIKTGECDTVTVEYKQKTENMKKGEYSYDAIFTELNKLVPIPEGYKLSYDTGSGLKPFNENGVIQLCSDTKFFSHPPEGPFS